MATRKVKLTYLAHVIFRLHWAGLDPNTQDCNSLFKSYPIVQSHIELCSQLSLAARGACFPFVAPEIPHWLGIERSVSPASLSPEELKPKSTTGFSSLGPAPSALLTSLPPWSTARWLPVSPRVPFLRTNPQITLLRHYFHLYNDAITLSFSP